MSFAITPVGSLMGACFAASPAIANQVISVIAATLSVDPATITPQTKFQDLMAGDSTKIVELVQAMENEFDEALGGDPIADSVYRKWVTVQDGIDYLASLGQ